jgi:hypothetical protein
VEGQISNPNFSDYNIPAMDDMPPALSHELVEREGAEVQGLGETALPPVPPAIGNALYSRGIHVTELPISAEQVLDAVDTRDGREGPTLSHEHIEKAGEHASGPPEETLTSANGLGVAKPLLLGTLLAGLLALVVYLLLRRTDEVGR